MYRVIDAYEYIHRDRTFRIKMDAENRYIITYPEWIEEDVSAELVLESHDSETAQYILILGGQENVDSSTTILSSQISSPEELIIRACDYIIREGGVRRMKRRTRNAYVRERNNLRRFIEQLNPYRMRGEDWSLTRTYSTGDRFTTVDSNTLVVKEAD